MRIFEQEQITLEAVKRCIEQEGEDVNEKNASGKPILAWAIWNNEVDIVDYLLQKGADVNATTNSSPSQVVCHEAAKMNNVQILQMLKEKGANFQPSYLSGRLFDFSVLAAAAERGHKEAVEWLVENVIPPFNQEYILDSCFAAIANGHEAVVRVLLPLVKNVQKRKNLLDYGLASSSAWGRLPLAKTLLELGADVNNKSDIGKTPIIHAFYNKHFDLVKLYLNAGARLNSFFDYAKSLIGFAANPSELQEIVDAPFSLVKDGRQGLAGIPIYPELTELKKNNLEQSNLIISDIGMLAPRLSGVRKLLKRVEEIEKTTYGNEQKKSEKMDSLTTLIDSLMNKTEKSVTQLIEEWKIQEINGVSNWSLCSMHRREPESLGFFGKVIELYNNHTQTTTEKLINNLLDEDHSEQQQFRVP